MLNCAIQLKGYSFFSNLARLFPEFLIFLAVVHKSALSEKTAAKELITKHLVN